MDVIDSLNAQINLGALMDRAVAGEEIVISGSGTPVACLTRIQTCDDATPRVPGMFAGLFPPARLRQWVPSFDGMTDKE